MPTDFAEACERISKAGNAPNQEDLQALHDQLKTLGADTDAYSEVNSAANAIISLIPVINQPEYVVMKGHAGIALNDAAGTVPAGTDLATAISNAQKAFPRPTQAPPAGASPYPG